MARIVGHATIELSVTIQLNESEARAMDALVGYGDDKFIEAFYEKLGKAYMKDHEKGLRSLFESMRQQLPGPLSRVNDARRTFNGEER